MVELTCGGCGNKITLGSFLTASEERCGECGRSVIGSGDLPPGRPVPPAEVNGARSPRLAKEWERSGLVLGAVAGGMLVLAIGAFGGRGGLAFVGGTGGAALGLLVGGGVGIYRGLVWGIHFQDFTVVNTASVACMVGGVMAGGWAGSYLKEVNAVILSLAMIAGGMVGAAIGAVAGSALGLRAEARVSRQGGLDPRN